MANEDLSSLITTSKFMLVVDNVARATFQKVSGGGTESEVIEYQESGPNGKVVDRKIMGRTTYNDLEFSTAIDADTYLSEWRKAVRNGDLAGGRRGGSIIALNSQEQPVAEWVFENGWPSKLEFGEFDATANDVAIQTMTLVVEFFERVQ